MKRKRVLRDDPTKQKKFTFSDFESKFSKRNEIIIREVVDEVKTNFDKLIIKYVEQSSRYS